MTTLLSYGEVAFQRQGEIIHSSRVDFSTAEEEAYRVDLEKVGEHDYKPSFWKLQHTTRERLMAYLIAMPEESRKREVAKRLCDLIGNMYPIADQEVKKYIRRILDDMIAEQVHDCLEREYSYRNKIKAKIRALATAHAEEVFFQWLDADKIHTTKSYSLPETISPVEKGQAIAASLYDSEAKMNNLEAKVINEIANLDNILFWHKIIERKGFCTEVSAFLGNQKDY